MNKPDFSLFLALALTAALLCAAPAAQAQTTATAAEPVAKPAQADPAALYKKGLAYLDAKGDKRNYQAALKCILASAEAGYAPAQLKAGDLYFEGLEINPDYKKAAAWYHKAAAKGAPQANYNLGYMYARGLGVKKDLTKAYLYYDKAAKARFKDADDMRRDVELDMTPAQAAKAKRLAGR